VNEDQQASIVIRPRIMPRDFIDVCLGLPIGILLAALFFGIPALLAFILARSLGVGLFPSFFIAFLAYFLAYGFFLLFAVRRLTIAADGLHFHRILGSPKFLSWERISSVAVASRSELVLRGWLWPLFPSREITPSLSALHHYRITWDTGFCYYPPSHAKDFEQHVVGKLRNDRDA
jgi:hypothetical protein